MTEDQWENILFKFLCNFMNGTIKKFDLTDYEHRKALAKYISEVKDGDTM